MHAKYRTEKDFSKCTKNTVSLCSSIKILIVYLMKRIFWIPAHRFICEMKWNLLMRNCMCARQRAHIYFVCMCVYAFVCVRVLENSKKNAQKKYLQKT